MMCTVALECLHQLNDIVNMEIHRLIFKIVLPVFESPSAAAAGLPVGANCRHGVSCADVFLTFLSFTLIAVPLENQACFHEIVEFWVINVLFGHMIHNICSFIDWNFSTHSFNFVDVWLDSTI